MNQLRPNHYLVLFTLFLTVLIGQSCGKKSSSTDEKECSCPAYMELTDYVTRYQTGIKGSLTLSPVPLDQLQATTYLYIDEQHVFSEERHRIVEQKVEITYDREYFTCGTNEVNDDEPMPIDDGYTAGKRSSYSCSCGMALTNSYASSEQTFIKAGITGSVDTFPNYDINISFNYPDHRSKYFVAILIDVDGDGTVSEGDYFTKDFTELDLQSQTPMKLTAERITKEKTVAEGRLNIGNLPEANAGATMHVELLDVSVKETPRKIADQTKDVQEVDEDYAFELFATPETENAVWQVKAWIDQNNNGEVDDCDYVDAEEQIWYSLDKIKGVVIPLAHKNPDAECSNDDPADPIDIVVPDND